MQLILDKKGGLKVKIRNLLAVVAMLSVFLFSAGTAFAVFGVNDAVPGQDVVFPIICEGHANPPTSPATFGTLDTLWAIAEKNGGSHFPDSDFVVCADVFVYDSRSILRFDTEYCWTAFDVVTDSCAHILSIMSPNAQELMEVESNGKTFFAGYVIVQQSEAQESITNRFVPWVYLTDLQKGFASGMNGISAENGTSTNDLGEVNGAVAVAAESIYPRVFILNDKAETWNWWILLLGRNAYTQLGLPSFNRVLDCQVCNEEEDCESEVIPIPNELNIINVREHLTSTVIPTCFGQSGCPIAGFGRCTIREAGETILFGQIQIQGTANFGPIDITAPSPFYSLYGWSYQRAAESTATLSWDVIHEIHRVYCSGVIPGVNGDGNEAACVAGVL